jgi:RNA polymerase sigma-70 factor (ECF subfamily)
MCAMTDDQGDRGDDAVLVSQLQASRARFLELVEGLRPDLHRYCARMTGSIADGEDVVQDTLARAYYELSGLKQLPALRSWLFQIAHNRALDFVRRYERRMSEPLDLVEGSAPDPGSDAESALAQEEAVRAAVSRFLDLPPAQRSCVILKDVLDHSLDQIAELLSLSLPAVKAALHRGRARLRELNAAAPVPGPSRPSTPALVRYAALFNARDWQAVRAMLAQDVKLDLVARERRSGRRVAEYCSNYDAASDWHLVPAWLDGREVIAVFRGPGDAKPGYFIELGLTGEEVVSIRDFRYVPYIAREAKFELAAAHPFAR